MHDEGMQKQPRTCAYRRSGTAGRSGAGSGGPSTWDAACACASGSSSSWPPPPLCAALPLGVTGADAEACRAAALLPFQPFATVGDVGACEPGCFLPPAAASADLRALPPPAAGTKRRGTTSTAGLRSACPRGVEGSIGTATGFSLRSTLSAPAALPC